MLIEVNSSDIMTLADFILDTVADICYQGIDANDCRVYQIGCRPNVSYEIAKHKAEEVVQGLIEQVKNAQKQPEPPKQPEPDYKTEVFNLISSRPIPGVASIEVNESQKKFAVQYQQPTIGVDLAEESISDNTVEQAGYTYTINELSKEWDAYVFVLNGNCDGPRNSNGELLGFRTFIEFLLIPHSIVYADDGIFAVKFDDKKE